MSGSISSHPGAAAQPLSAQLTAAVTLIVVGSLALLVGFGYWAAYQVDAQALSLQTRFVTKGIADEFEKLPREQESSAIWDEAVINARAGNQAWLEENLGLWMGTYFGHDRVYVLSPGDVAIHAMKDEQTVEAAQYLTEEPVLRDLVDQLRGEMKEASQGLSDSTLVVTGMGVSDLVMIDGMPAIASVKPIVPSSDSVMQEPGTEFLHISVQRFDETMIGAISGQYELGGARLLGRNDAAESDASVALTNRQGKILGILGWDGNRPGTEMISDTAPAGLVAIGAGLALIVWLLRRLRRSSSMLQVSEAQAQFLAFHDTLTGLPNRALFEDRLERAMVQMRRSGRRMALHYIDLDRFKNVNDTLGHGAGDELVRQVGTRLQAVVRESDTVARLGGDEFAVVQGEIANESEAEQLAERILAEMAREFDLSGEPAFVSASIGIVVSRGEYTHAHEMLRKADIALYEAKNKGRARYEVFAGDMDDVVRRRRSVEHDLRTALETGTQLRVAYQPLYEADGKKIVGAEALLRWDHPVHGSMSPELFISIAEERGLIEPLGEFVLTLACAFTAASELPWIAVNISPVQFRNASFAQKVMTVLASTGLSPNRLQLEITEGLLLESTGRMETTLKALRDAGIKIALDDFGTGYSSMNYLRRYSIDKLKIDRSFVQQLGTSVDADAIVRLMISLARSMQLEVTAEGVETTEQRDHLAAIGCHELQGFLMSKAVPDTELLAMLAHSTGEQTDDAAVSQTAEK